MPPTIGVNLRVTGHCNQGGRKYMEDMFSVAYQQTADELDLEYAYFGIFDGHGGHEAASFAKEHLMKAIVSQPGFWSENDEDVLRAIKDGFIATHYAMWRNLENWPKTASGLPSTSGTTASIAFIRKSNIYIGHVGDSCIVLGYQEPGSDKWKGAALTEDHKPESPCEHQRIRQAGGQVICKAGVPRVVWHRPRMVHQGPMTRSTHIDQIPFLAVARSLGDLWSYNPDSDRFVVSPEPDVFVHHIKLGRDKCLIFGTDGLWNMLTPDQAVGIVKKAEKNNKNSAADGQDQAWLNPSKCLVDSAIEKWLNSKLRADNTSAVTLLLDPLGPPSSQVLEQNTNQQDNKTEFVPYHIESYKVHEGKSSCKPSNHTNGLAICTWYPRKNVAEPLDKANAGMTTLKTMEALFGDSVNSEETIEVEKDKIEEEEEEEEGDLIEEKDLNICESESHPPMSYASVLKSCSKSERNTKEDLQIIEDMSLIQINNNEHNEHWVKKPRDSIVSSPILREEEKTEYGMTLRNDASQSKNCQTEPTLVKQIKRNIKRGKRRKIFDRGSKEDLKLDIKSKNKRRHSSLVESISVIYEPGVKRRSKSEDQRKFYESDTENEYTKLKTEKVKLKTRRDVEKAECSSEHEFEPMKLRSNTSVRTLRSRNINLDICLQSNKRITKNCKISDDENLVEQYTNKYCKLVVPRSDIQRTVYTRSQNKKIKK